MMSSEERKVLSYLRQHLMASVGDVARACVPGASHEWTARILWNLEWLGYVVCYGSEAVQITENGLRRATG
jgi:hypothetical protein